MLTTRWVEEPTAAAAADTAAFARHWSMPTWVAELFLRRFPSASADAAKGEALLKPGLKALPDPFSLTDMREAAELVADAVMAESTIAVYGDYDVDGTVGSALLRRFFRSLGVDPIVYQPDRAKEGYGVNALAMEALAGAGTELLITVDCGITNNAAIAHARELGMEVVICDHHEQGAELPPATAILDHKRHDETSAIRSLCGTGVAFYLAMAVRSVLRERGYFADAQAEPDLRQWLDLVAVATIADMVPLVEENRILTVFGLDKLRRSPLPGLAALLKVAGVDPAEVQPFHVGFTLGPRINASGRLGTANCALELLSTDDPEEANALAEQLDQMNDDRRALQDKVAESALKQAKEFLEQNPDAAALVLAHDEWHEGVIGIVASKVVEAYHRPTVMLTFQTHEGKGKGSVRSAGGVDVVEALRACSEQLLGFGGHKAAAGLSLLPENLETFRAGFIAAVAKATAEGVRGVKEYRVDMEMPQNLVLSSADIKWLDRLGPFGIANPEPQFLFRNCDFIDVKILKEVHARVTLKLPSGQRLDGFWPSGAARLVRKPGEKVDVLAIPLISRFRGEERLELRVRDIR